MKRTDISKYRGMDEKQLHAEIRSMRHSMAEMMMKNTTEDAPKTHLLSNKKRELAVILTILREKRS